VAELQTVTTLPTGVMLEEITGCDGMVEMMAVTGVRKLSQKAFAKAT